MRGRVILMCLLSLFLLLAGCHKGDGDDKTPTGGVKTTGVQDDDDKLFDVDEEFGPGGGPETTASAVPVAGTNMIGSYLSAQQGGQAVKTTNTYAVANGGRQSFRLSPRFGYLGQTAVVVFSDMPRVGYRIKLNYANRIRSGTHNGFVFRNSPIGGYFAHSPFGRHPRTLYLYY